MALPGLTAGAGLAAVAALVARDPHRTGSWGICPVLVLTGLQCPGCGGLRAVNDLAHLRVLDAVSSNVLTVVLVVVGTLTWGLWVRARLVGVPFRLERWVTPTSAWTALAVVLVFAVVRNTTWGGALAP